MSLTHDLDMCCAFRPLAMVVFIEKEYCFTMSSTMETEISAVKVKRPMSLCSWSMVFVNPEMLVRPLPHVLHSEACLQIGRLPYMG